MTYSHPNNKKSSSSEAGGRKRGAYGESEEASGGAGAGGKTGFNGSSGSNSGSARAVSFPYSHYSTYAHTHKTRAEGEADYTGLELEDFYRYELSGFPTLVLLEEVLARLKSQQERLLIAEALYGTR